MPQEQEIVGVQMKEGGNASHTPGGWWMERRGLLDALKAWTGIQSAVTVSKEDPASPQFDLNRQDAKIKNQR